MYLYSTHRELLLSINNTIFFHCFTNQYVPVILKLIFLNYFCFILLINHDSGYNL